MFPTRSPMRHSLLCNTWGVVTVVANSAFFLFLRLLLPLTHPFVFLFPVSSIITAIDSPICFSNLRNNSHFWLVGSAWTALACRFALKDAVGWLIVMNGVACLVLVQFFWLWLAIVCSAPVVSWNIDVAGHNMLIALPFGCCYFPVVDSLECGV